MGEPAAPQIVGLIGNDMALGDKRSSETQHLANMSGGSKAAAIGEFIKADRQRRIGKPRNVGRGDTGHRSRPRQDMANHTAALQIACGKLKPAHGVRRAGARS